MRISRVLIIVLFALQWVTSQAQNPVNLYDFAYTPQAGLHNPSYNTYRDWHITIPVFTNKVMAGTSGVVIQDLFADDGVPFADKLKTAVYNMTAKDRFLATQTNEIINIGKRYKKGYYLSAGYYQEFNVFSTFPEDMSRMFYEGNTQINRKYRIDGYSALAEMLGVYHFGIRKDVDHEESIGLRFKLYLAGFNAQTRNNQGMITTIDGAENIYRHVLSEFDSELNTSGITNFDFDNFDYGQLLKRITFTGNKGVGIDLGYSKQIDYHWYLSASLIDFGFLYHNKGVTNYAFKGSYTTEGMYISTETTGTEDYWVQFKGDFKEKVELGKTFDSYISWRPIKLNIFGQYSFGERYNFECNYHGESQRSRSLKHSIGGLLHLERRNEYVSPFAALFYERNFNDKALLRLTYAADRFSFTNLGLAVGVNVWQVNFFAGANNIVGLFDLTKANTASVQFGLSIVMDDNRY